jgi:hypothetical protein
MWIPKPKTLHGNKDILQCYEALICGYLKAYQVPYHWLFADSWGFYYTCDQQYGAYEPTCTYPMWRNLNRVYGVKKTLFHDTSLQNLMECMEQSRNPVFLILDQYDLPWVTEYRMIHHDHCVLVSKVSGDGKQVYIQDLWPNEYRDWYDFADIDKAFRARGRRAWQLSNPTIKSPFIDKETIRLLLNECADRMRGTQTAAYTSGILGLRRFQTDLLLIQPETLLPAEQRFDLLRRVVDVRLLFLEFICYLEQSDEWNEILPEGIITAVERCVAAWYSLRNYIVLSSLKHQYKAAKCARLVEKTIECEYACLQEVEFMLNQLD